MTQTQPMPDWAKGIVDEVDFNACLSEGIYSAGLPYRRFVDAEIGVSDETFLADMQVWTKLFKKGHIEEAGDYAQSMLVHYRQSPKAIRTLTEAYLPHLPKILDDEYILGPWITARLGKACLDLGLDDLTDKLKECVEKQVANNICKHPQSFLTDTRVMLHQTGTDIREAMVGFLGELSFNADGHLHFSRVTKDDEWFRAVVPAGEPPVFYYATHGKGSYDYDKANKRRDFKRFKRWVNQSAENPKAIPSFWEAMTVRIAKLKPELPKSLAKLMQDNKPSV